MTDHKRLSRRRFLVQSLGLGCSLAASPLVTPVTFASAPGDARLVVIILRGAMDGLDAIRPYGAPEFAAYRAGLAGKTPGTHDLDGFYALHPALAPLLPLYGRGEMGAVHAVSTPYRDKRSHFDGQDILEAGAGEAQSGRMREGWLNRLLQEMPGAHAQTAYAVGSGGMLLTRGAAQVAEWSPEAALALSPQAERLLNLVMHDDPLFRDAVAEAVMLSQEGVQAMLGDAPLDAGGMINAMQESMTQAKSGAQPDEIARFAAQRLRGETRIAAYSLGGFDTHGKQGRGLTRSLGVLASNILVLRDELGSDWGKTAVVALTEFGRTARVNGTGGTDHGTGGAMLYAGGALRGGRVLGQWPGLEEAALYARRDLMPTRDLRAHLAWILRSLYGVDVAALERRIFPGVELGARSGLLL